MRLTSALFITAVIFSTTAVFAQPKIKMVGGTSFSFGKVLKGSKPTQIMMLKNIGSDTLNVTEVSAQCGCTAAMISKQKVAPSDSGKLSISFNTAAYEGQVTKHVYVSSNDPSTPKVTIEFSANVIQAINANPSYITFNITKNDSTYSKTITLTNMTEQSVKILGVNPQLDHLEVSLLKNLLMPGEQTELQTIFRPSNKATTQGTIELKTDFAAQPSIEIRVFEWHKQP